MSADPRAPGIPRNRSADREATSRSGASARASVTGHNVRYVLAPSIAAVVFAFLIVYFVYV